MRTIRFVVSLIWLSLSALALAEVTPATVDTKRADSVEGPELAAFKKAIRAKYDLKERAFAAHDAETIVAKFYTEDVISIGEGEGIFVGRDKIRPLYQDVVQHYRVKIDSVHPFVSGSAGWDWADFKVLPLDPKEKPWTFAILFLWTRVGGEWMCKGDFFVFGSIRAGKLEPPPTNPAAK